MAAVECNDAATSDPALSSLSAVPRYVHESASCDHPADVQQQHEADDGLIFVVNASRMHSRAEAASVGTSGAQLGSVLRNQMRSSCSSCLP